MKKPSATKSQTPPSFVFFTDRDLGKHIFPSVLREVDLRVEAHDEHFDEKTSDEAWLREVGAREWVVLTADYHIRYRSRETEALMEAGVRAFVLIGDYPVRDRALNFLDTVPRVQKLLEDTPGAFIAKIYRSPPRVKMWLTYDEWEKKRRERATAQAPN